MKNFTLSFRKKPVVSTALCAIFLGASLVTSTSRDSRQTFLSLKESVGSIIPCRMSLRAEIFPFVLPKNVARKLFGFGAGTKKFSRHNEKILAPVFQDSQTAIRAFDVRILKKADQLTLAYRPEHADRTSLGKKRSTWMIVKIAKENRKNDYLRYPNSLTF